MPDIDQPVKCLRCNTIFPEGRTTPCPIRISQEGYDSTQTRRCNGVRRPLTSVERERLASSREDR